MKVSYLLQALCAIQLLLLVYIYTASDDKLIQEDRKVLDDLLSAKEVQMQKIDSTKLAVEAATYRLSCAQKMSHAKPGGTVLLLLTTKPLAYYNLLSFKMNNILQNIPSDWVVQIFYKNSATFRKGLILNPGWKRHFEENNRIFTMEIPRKRELSGHREGHHRLQPWLWRHLLAEDVLVVDGNFVICSNSPYSILDFVKYDYIGLSSKSTLPLPLESNGISFRKRSSVLAVLSAALMVVTPSQNRSLAYLSWGNEEDFFFQHMTMQNNEQDNNIASFLLANGNISGSFSASDSTDGVNLEAFSLSGKLRGASHEDRAGLLKICPEGKTLFTSLHHPGCFGNNMKRDACQSSICALNLNDSHRSC